MIHQFRDKKQIAQRKNIRKIIILCGFFVVCASIGLFTFTGKFFTSLGRPLWIVRASLGSRIESVGYLVRTKSSVFAENETLKKQNADLTLSMTEYAVIKRENDELKELFGRMPVKDTFILASILTRPNHSPYDTIIVDAGLETGIHESSVVYANAEIPIGKVSNVYDKASLVALYSNPGQITEAMLDGSNASVELIGRGGGNFEMTIPLELPSESGTSVMLPGIQSEVIAIIDAVISSPTDPVKKVILHSPVNIQSLKWVHIKSRE